MRFFNKLSLAAKFPDEWKIAHIAPIFESGTRDGNDRSNYRPILVLPFVSRLTPLLISHQFMYTLSQITSSMSAVWLSTLNLANDSSFGLHQ